MKARFSTRLSPITIKQIKELAAKLGIAQSEVIQRAVDHYSYGVITVKENNNE